MYVIGTAGHVDHGKSALVEALSGFHPDRLAEEKLREMTIDLGFAWFNLPNGEEVGVVDVPGHRDFIENMLAGVGGIDAAILVIAADEGVMPQTREHLAILDLLQVKYGLVALTKIDLVDDPDWLSLVEEDIRQVLLGTVLEEAQILRVSAKTHAGIEELKNALQKLLEQKPARINRNKPRLPVDRVFTIAGFGTVVTGTLSDGTFQVGDEVEILPGGLKARIRGLQTHKKKEEIALPGRRTAVNLTGVSKDQILRGNVVAHPGDYRPTRLLDCSFRLLKNATTPLKHNSQVKLFVWASEVLGRVRLLGSEELAPGEEGWLQLELEDDVVVARGDRYILRRPSPPETIGGGMIIDPFPKRRHKRFAQDVLDRLEALTQADIRDGVLGMIESSPAITVKELLQRANLVESEALALLQVLLTEGLIIDMDKLNTPGKPLTLDTPLITHRQWQNYQQAALGQAEKYHQNYPLRKGIPKEEMKSRLNLSARALNNLIAAMVEQGRLIDGGKWVAKADFQRQLNAAQTQEVDLLLKDFIAAPYSPPSVKDCIAKVGEELYTFLVDEGILLPVSAEVVFRKEDYERLVLEIQKMIRTQGEITAAQVRDHFQTSRKYVLALLEYLDAQGITERVGDARRLKSGNTI